MSDLTYLLLMVATAVMTVTVLTVGTLAAAGILQRRPRPTSHERAEADPSADAPDLAETEPAHRPDREAA